MLLLAASALAAEACNCPKESLLKMYGTVSALGAAKPVGPRRAPEPQAETAARPGIPPILLLISSEGETRPDTFLRVRRLDTLPSLLVEP